MGPRARQTACHWMTPRWTNCGTATRCREQLYSLLACRLASQTAAWPRCLRVSPTCFCSKRCRRAYLRAVLIRLAKLPLTGGRTSPLGEVLSCTLQAPIMWLDRGSGRRAERLRDRRSTRGRGRTRSFCLTASSIRVGEQLKDNQKNMHRAYNDSCVTRCMLHEVQFR